MPLIVDVPAIRVFPMSDRIAGFRRTSIAEIQTEFFLKRFAAGGARFRYPSSGLHAEPASVVLFQFRAHAIACALFVRDEKRPRRPAAKSTGPAGVLHFDPGSIEVFAPWDADAMRKVWPGFRSFGHVKQRLNPGQWGAFRRRLKGIARPVESAATRR